MAFNYSRWLRLAIAGVIPSTDQKYSRIKTLLHARTSDISEIYPILRQIQNPYTMRGLVKEGVFQQDAGKTLDRQLAARQENMDQFGAFSQISIADYLGYTQSVLLKDADQMGMAASLEIREPFFDHDLVEYVLNVPDALKYPHYPKQLLVESMNGLLPDEIVHRKKQGFVIPYDIWMKNDLKEFCTEKINRLASRGIFKEKGIKEYWQRFLQGKDNIRWADVWIFVVLEHWLEKNQIM